MKAAALLVGPLAILMAIAVSIVWSRRRRNERR